MFRDIENMNSDFITIEPFSQLILISMTIMYFWQLLKTTFYWCSSLSLSLSVSNFSSIDTSDYKLRSFYVWFTCNWFNNLAAYKIDLYHRKKLMCRWYKNYCCDVIDANKLKICCWWLSEIYAVCSNLSLSLRKTNFE